MADTAAASSGGLPPVQPSDGPLSVDQAKAQTLRQIEFYFGNANLPYDKFLWLQTQKEDGWVPIATIASFKRMKPMKDIIDVTAMADVLRTSESLLEVDDKGEKVRRKVPLERVADAFDRTIYAKGFPVPEPAGLQEKLESYFAQFGTVVAVRLRREVPERKGGADKKAAGEAEAKDASTSAAGGKPFKGSVFVEFQDLEDANKFLALEPKPQYEGTELLTMSKEAYATMKAKEKGIDPATIHRGSSGGGTAANNGSGGAGSTRPSGSKFNAFKEMARIAAGKSSILDTINGGSSSGASNKPAPPKRSDPLEFEFQGVHLVTRQDGTVDPDKVVSVPNSVLRFEGAGEGGDWRDLKDQVNALYPTSFVDYPAGARSGAVAFRSALSDEDFANLVSKNIKSPPTSEAPPLTWTRMDDDASRAFYLQRANFRAGFLLDRRLAEFNDGKGSKSSGGGGRGSGRGGRGGRGGKGGRGGRGGGRGGKSDGDKRKRDDNDSGPPTIVSAKKQKTAE